MDYQVMNRIWFYIIKIILIIYTRRKYFFKKELLSHSNLIIAANHQSHIDFLFFASTLTWKECQKMHVVSKLENLKGLNGLLIKLMKINVIPLDRKGNFWPTLFNLKEILLKDAFIFIHPEGTRSSDGNLLPFKNGLSFLALQTHSPILPVYLDNTFRVLKKYSFFPKPNRVRVFFGDLMDTNSYRQDLKDNEIRNVELIKKITEDLRNNILTLKKKSENI
jgi:1-acyl-sn-glycerol-3-phosphate acyltransferase